MRFASYFICSLLSMGMIVGYAIFTREQFYPTILFLVSSKVSFIVGGNMAIASALLFSRISKTIFLGDLRDAEVELLYERAKFSITETCLALTIFRNELTPSTIFLFGFLLFLKAFHWLSKSRLEFLEQVVPVSIWTRTRLISLMIILLLTDSYVAYRCAHYTMVHGKSVIILFGFEFGLLVISIINSICRYILFALDSSLTNGLTSKGLYVMLIDLLCYAIRFVTYVCFFSLMFVYYGMPIHIIREVWIAFSTFQQKLSSFIKYLQLTNNLDQRLDNATEEEIALAGDCLICREPMESGKKLSCTHVFHLNCLQSWLQHQQSCPLCRSDISISTMNNPPAAPVEVPPPANMPAPVPPPSQNVPASTQNDNWQDDNGVKQREDTTGFHSNVLHSNSTSRDRDSSSTSVLESQTASQKSVQQRTAPQTFPHLYVVCAVPSVAVHAEPLLTSTTLRFLSTGTIVFVQYSSRNDLQGESWLRIPDGWVLENPSRGAQGSFLNPVTRDVTDKAIVPFHTSALPTPMKPSLSDFAEILPQPVGELAQSTNRNNFSSSQHQHRHAASRHQCKSGEALSMEATTLSQRSQKSDTKSSIASIYDDFIDKPSSRLSKISALKSTLEGMDSRMHELHESMNVCKKLLAVLIAEEIDDDDDHHDQQQPIKAGVYEKRAVSSESGSDLHTPLATPVLMRSYSAPAGSLHLPSLSSSSASDAILAQKDHEVDGNNAPETAAVLRRAYSESDADNAAISMTVETDSPSKSDIENIRKLRAQKFYSQQQQQQQQNNKDESNFNT